MIPSWPKVMGVMNLTPDSFSDGGVLTQRVALKQRLIHWAQSTYPLILDFGAASTAPKGKPISVEEEWLRYQRWLLPELELIRKHCPQALLSFDTFRPEVMARLIEHLGSDLIWNDVSGVVDQEGLALLNAYPQLSYILCHNLVGERERSFEHLSFIQDDLCAEDVRSWFEKQIQALKVTNPIWLDPCFGFAKTASQNWELFHSLAQDKSFYEQTPLVIGLSRKSFVRAALFEHRPETRELARDELNRELDAFQSRFHHELIEKWNGPLVFRVHHRI